MFAIILFAWILFPGCVHYDQKVILREDGSGSMKLHYWSSMNSFTMGNTLGKLEFEELKAKDKYTSDNTEVTRFRIEDQLDDSTKHVYIELNFKDINKLNDAKGFESTRVSWNNNSNGIELKFIVLKDTAASKQMRSSSFNVTFEFEMPSEIISTSGTINGQTVKFTYTLADLVKDLEMTTVVKKTGRND